MDRRIFFLKLAFCVLMDIADFTLGRIPGFGMLTDGLSTLVLYLMWGPAGLAQAFELIDFTEQIDAFIPTATLIALYVGWRQGAFGRAATSEISQKE